MLASELVPPGFGLATLLHLVPFQCNARVSMDPVVGSKGSPTAQASVAESALTPCRLPDRPDPRAGLRLDAATELEPRPPRARIAVTAISVRIRADAPPR
jgi:hypothetical protein